MYWLPQTSVDTLDKQRRTFFWQGGGLKRKYHLVKWEIICKSKKKGGLGITDIRKMNISLLCKWWWKLHNESSLWQDLVKAKYLKNDLISTLKPKFNDSPIWKDLLKVRHIYLRGRKLIVGNGDKTLLWKDCWLDGTPLCSKFSAIFELCNEKNITVKNFVDKAGELSFRRWLPEQLAEQYVHMCQLVLNQSFENRNDRSSWRWTKQGAFTVKCTYDYLTKDDAGYSYGKIWKAKIPYKIKIFVWLIELGAVLTKDNMVKRKWIGDPSCRFCETAESVDHLFFQCSTAKVVWGIVALCIGAINIPNNIRRYWVWIDIHLPNSKHVHAFGLAGICWAIWKARNKVCFDKKLIKHPAEILCHACAFLNFWTCLHKTDFQAQIAEGIKILLSTVCSIVASQQRPPPPAPPRLLTVEEEDDSQEED